MIRMGSDTLHDEQKARDVCILENGETNCGPLIEAHKECMRSHGFKV